MKIEKKLLPKSVVELTLEEDTKSLNIYRKKALDSIRKKTKIKGFRPGAQIPDNILIKEYGDDYINSMAIESAIDVMYQDALKKEKLFPVAQAEIHEVISQSPIKIRLTVEVFPSMSINDKYKKIKLKKTSIEVSESEVKGAIKEIEKKFTSFSEREDSSIEMGDRVTIDTHGFGKDNSPLEGTQMQDYPIIIGSNVLVPGFEEGLIGAKVGDELSLNITFPKDYHNGAFAGKETIFKVNIKKIEKAVVPELTPEFIKNLRGKDIDLEGFKALIKEEIKETKEMNARLDEEHKLIEELKKVSTYEIGEKMLENQIQNVFAEIKENLGKDNIRLQDYLESLRLSEEEYKEKNVKPVAERRLEGELILHKLMELENIEASEEEMNIEIEKAMSRFESEDVRARLKELYVPKSKYYEEMRQKLGYRKLIDTFFE